MSFDYSNAKRALLFAVTFFAATITFAQNPLAPALGFNVFTQKNATLITNESEGPVAIGGDLILTGDYRVSNNYAGTFKVNNVPVTLVIGGKVVYQSGSGLTINQNGYVKIGDCQQSKTWYTDQNNAYSPIRITPGSDYNGSPRIMLQANSQQLGVSANNNSTCQGGLIDFDAAFAAMKASSLSISACTDNANITNANGNPIPHNNFPNQVKINLNAGINTLNVNGSDFNNIQDFVYNTQPDANHVLIININAAGSFDWKVPNSGGIGLQNCAYILYNFYNTTSLNVVGYGAVQGNVLAPFADINKTSNQANIEGQLIAQSFIHSGGEMHYPPFNANIPGCAVTCTLGVSGTPANITCFNSNNGSIDVTASGAKGSVSYSWNDGIITEDRSNLAPGSYKVTATDANSCKATADFTITQPDALSVTAVLNNVTTVGGNDGSIDVTVNGGTSAYSYSWSDNVTTEDRTNLSKGDYKVIIKDANQCSIDTTFKITDPECSLSASSTSANVTCFNSNNGSVDVTVSGATGAVFYVWNDGATTEDRTNLAPGNYSVTVKDAAGCTAETKAEITEPSKIVLTATKVNTTTCDTYDGSIDLTVNGGTPGYTYQWSNGATTEDISGLYHGDYTVHVTDANGCGADTTITIEMPACNLKIAFNKTNPTCFKGNDGKIETTMKNGSGDYTYQWSNGATTSSISGLSAGTYSVHVVDNKWKCTADGQVKINNPEQINVVIHSHSNLYPNNNCTGTVTLKATNGTAPYTFVWKDGAQGEKRTDLCYGKYYTVTVTDAKGCSVTRTGQFVPCPPKTTSLTAGASDNLFANTTADIATASTVKVTASPNPTPGLFKLAINSEVNSDATINIYNFSGKLVTTSTMNIAAGLNSKTFDLSKNIQGVYQLHVITGNTTQVIKIVLQK